MLETGSLPQLRAVPLSELPSKSPPAPKIKTDADASAWRTMRSYEDYAIFLRRLNEAVVSRFLPWSSSPSLLISSEQAIMKTLELLEMLDRWIDEIPPMESPQRFGNLAFRTWGARLEEVRSRVLKFE
ncbi:hypothetical protein H0H81_003840 [Sphagnurus paluster]|uniref:Serine/threonine-protein phosphatase 2A activator n=1 Tax=Sphagnurus paluster TaxID=117069 RepID=A0A9P7KJK6_9AGAR|nr:hypothetical protein H0H81_003840 [Sphagnurus paluster]